MSYELLVEEAAARDIADADAFYGDGILQEVDRLFARLTERPHMFPIVHADVRRGLLHRYPYAVFFVVEDESVVVLAVHHQRRDPAARPRR